MINAFCSTYTKHYRCHDREPEVESAKPCLYYNELVENFLPVEDSKDIYNPERDEVIIKEKARKSLISTYQASYCCNITKKSLVIDAENLDDDQFMVHFNQLYAKKTQRLLRPLHTGRRINGYVRFDNYYTGKTELQETINRNAYDYFKRDYDRGKNRLFAKRQKTWQEKKHKFKEETSDEIPEERPKSALKQKKESEVKEKICGICCQKFGDFSANTENKKSSE